MTDSTAAQGEEPVAGSEHAALGEDTLIDARPGDPQAFDALFGEESEAWPEHQTSRGFRAPWLATILLALLLVSGGLWLGAYLQRSESPSGSNPSNLTQLTPGGGNATHRVFIGTPGGGSGIVQKIGP